MCASTGGHPGNIECICVGEELLCGSSRRQDVVFMIYWCHRHCTCGAKTKVITDRYTKEISHGSDQHPGYLPLGSTGVTSHSCSKKCSNINRDCDRFFTGDCKCYADPVSSMFWHSGRCGLVSHLPKRDLAQHRRSYYLNATAQFAPSNKTPAPAPPGPHPDHAAQLASGLLPSPCNASYVSFGCSDSKDGIVHEPPQNWLGALLPENAKELPPVPKEFLRIHHGKEGKMQVLRPAVD
ncbi:hypothetical protein MMC22_004757 [Lobaria immixta]|nr:hypothetical protein [Lobaria immixta]